MNDRRCGLKPPFTRQQLDALARAEIAAAILLRGEWGEPVDWRRLGDPPGTWRIPDARTARGHPTLGLVVEVRGYVDGVEDPGLHCRDCPLSDLVAEVRDA